MIDKFVSFCKIWLWRFTVAILALFVLSLIFIYPPIVDLWIENDSSSFFRRIKFLYSSSVPAFIILLILGLSSTIIWYFFIGYDNAKKKFEDREDAQGRILLRKYEELKEISISNSINKTLKMFSDKYSYILGAQLYKFTEIPKNKTLTINVRYSHGYTKEQVDVNGIIQHNYNVSKRIHKDYKKGIDSFFKKIENVDGILDFIEKYTTEIVNKNIATLDFEDGVTYEFIKDAYQSLSRYYNDLPKPKFPLNTLRKLEEVNNKQRTGILRGIELDNPLMFQYKKGIENEKEGRVYITNTLTIEDEKHIMLLAIDPELLPQDDIDYRKRFNMIIEEIELYLYQIVENVYNEIEEVQK